MPLLFWMPFVVFAAMCEVIADETRRMAQPADCPVTATATQPSLGD